MLCAMVNNNVRCYNESMEFAERVEDTLDEDHKVPTHHTMPCLLGWLLFLMTCVCNVSSMLKQTCTSQSLHERPK